MTKIEIKGLMNNKECFFKFEKDQEKTFEDDMISCQNIKEIFYNNLIKNEKFLEENNLLIFEKEDIIFEYIRYFNNDVHGWILINEEEYIKLNNEEITKILINFRIQTKIEKNILNQYKNLKNLVVDFDYNKYTNDNKYNDEKYINSEIDIVVLTANPLVEKMDSGNIKELKSMNDFNNVTNSIVNVVRKSSKLIIAEFLPLTKYNLKRAILKKPKILHLICKSTYIVPDKIEENDESYKFANLIFEKDNYYEMELINEKYLDSFFEYKEKNEQNFQEQQTNNVINEEGKEEINIKKSQIKEEENNITEIIKNIVLIISTQLSNDVYKIFRKYDFKNFYIQHTTVADSSFIADLNEQFYKNIIYQTNTDINSPNINQFFEDAVNIYFNNTEQFCCCFHEHKSDCPFLKNMNNELYIRNEKDNKNNEKNKDIKNCGKNGGKKNNKKGNKINITERKDYSTHFNHLRYKCNCNNCKIETDFCLHKEESCDNNPCSENLNCCCLYGINESKHNINSIFLNNILLENNNNNKTNYNKCIKINENKNNKIIISCGLDDFGQIKNNDLLPDYEKMKFIVGKNKLIYEIYNKIKNNRKLINIYNNKYYNNSELEELADIIIQYLKERINLKLKDNIFNNSENDLKMKKDNTNEITFSNSEKNISFNIESMKSDNIGKINNQEYYDFEKIYFKNKKDFKIIEKKENKIYFIIFHDINLENDFINYYKENSKIKSKIVIFSNNNNIDRNIIFDEKIEFNTINKGDYYIKYQREKIKKEKEQFENFINEEMAGNRDIEPIQFNSELSINYEILFLFYCLKDNIQEDELKMIYLIKNSSLFNEKEIKEEFGKFKNILERELNNFEKALDEAANFREVKIIKKEKTVKIYDLFYSELMPKINIILKKNNIYLYNWEGNFDYIPIINDEYNNLEQIIETKDNELKDKFEGSMSFLTTGNIKKRINEFNFNTIKEILENSFNNVILKITNKENIKYQKVIKNNNFNLYYDNWKIKITEPIKQNILVLLFQYYSLMFYRLIVILENNGISCESYNTIKNLGELLGIKNDCFIGVYNNYMEKGIFGLSPFKEEFQFSEYKKIFKHLIYNFFEILEENNFELCKKDSEIWEKLKYYIEDLSISYYSCLKIFNIDFKEKTTTNFFQDLFKNDFNLHARIILMLCIYSHNIKWLDKLDLKLGNIEEILSEEEIIRKFSECIIEINSNNNNTIIIEDKESKNLDDNKFNNIFASRVKYYFYRLKIKNRILNDNLKNELSNIGKIFKKEKYNNWEIRTYLLIAYFHLEKYHKNHNINDKEGFYNYLMFSYYASNYYKKDKQDYFEMLYSFNKINKKIDEEDKLNSENIKNICEEFNYQYKIDKSLENIFDEID